MITRELADQGADGIATESITRILANAGHQKTAIRELIRQVLVATDDSRTQLRTQPQLRAEAIHQGPEQATGKDGKDVRAIRQQ